MTKTLGCLAKRHHWTAERTTDGDYHVECAFCGKQRRTGVETPVTLELTRRAEAREAENAFSRSAIQYWDGMGF